LLPPKLCAEYPQMYRTPKREERRKKGLVVWKLKWSHVVWGARSLQAAGCHHCCLSLLLRTVLLYYWPRRVSYLGLRERLEYVTRRKTNRRKQRNLKEILPSVWYAPLCWRPWCTWVQNRGRVVGACVTWSATRPFRHVGAINSPCSWRFRVYIVIVMGGVVVWAKGTLLWEF